MHWTVYARYNTTEHQLDAEKIYESNQLMKIKVYGKKSCIILQNDYPFILFKNSKKAIKWKLIDAGLLDCTNPEDAAFIARIMANLEYQIKGTGKKHSDAILQMQGKP